MRADGMPVELNWLPQSDTWAARAETLRLQAPAAEHWQVVRELAEARPTAVQVQRLDRKASRLADAVGAPEGLERVRVALLGSSTTHHLAAAVRVAGMRHGMWIEVHEGGYGQYLQEVLDPSAALRAFAPEVVVFALDAEHLEDLGESGEGAVRERVALCWAAARRQFGAAVIQQTAMPRGAELLGSNEERLPESGLGRVLAFNRWVGPAAAADGVAVLALDRYVAWGGVDAWHSPALWHLAKQEVHPEAAPMWGELLARVVGAMRGRSRKCLVLDLDNTLWGGLVGEEGPEGIRVGHGSAVGEAHLAFQRFCAGLRRRGVLLAVCSKNEEAVARGAFLARPEMPLGLEDFACFRANWEDKATNLRAIAAALHLRPDSLVFVDDNAAERALVRRELPEVAVPEMGEDPAEFVKVLGRAGYFEAIGVTEEDRLRAGRFTPERMDADRVERVTDVASYLQSLQMRLSVRPFDEQGVERIVQLTNKTHQFNLTMRRTGADEVRGWMADPSVLSWQARLRDRFGDQGVIALATGRMEAGGRFRLGLWLMSCRVFGREVEQACLNVMREDLAERGLTTLLAPLRPTAKNGLLRERLSMLGFAQNGESEEGEMWQCAVKRPLLETAVAVDRRGW